MLNLASFNFKPVKVKRRRDLIWSVTMPSKNSGTIILQQFSRVVNTIADEHSNQPRVSYSNRLGSRPAMPEPQMHPYRVIKRYVTLHTKKAPNFCHYVTHSDIVNHFHVTSCHGHVMVMSWSWIVFPHSPPKNYFVKMSCSYVTGQPNCFIVSIHTFPD